MRYARFHAPAVLLALSSSIAVGADVSWIASEQADFGVGANWSTGTVPTATDVVVFNQPSNSIRLTNEPAAVTTGPIQVSNANINMLQQTGSGSHVWSHGGITINGGTLTTTFDGRLPGPFIHANNSWMSGSGTLGGLHGPSMVQLSGAGSRWGGSSFSIGNGGTAELVIEGGAVWSTSTRLRVGSLDASATAGTGTVIIRGNGSAWVASTIFSPTPAVIGQSSGGGWMAVEEGGTFSVPDLAVGFNPASHRPDAGTMILNGLGSTGNVSGALLVGRSSNQSSDVASAPRGYVLIRNGAVLNASTLRDFSVIGSNGGVGTLEASGVGSQFNSPRQLVVGWLGYGTVIIDQGATVTSGQVNSSTGSSGSVGYATSFDELQGAGTVSVTGTGSNWTQTGTLNIGFGRSGTLTISDGGIVGSVGGWVGRASPGSVFINGANSAWQLTSDLRVGSATADFAFGTASVSAGAQLLVAGTLRAIDRGTILLAGGKVQAGSIDLAGGNLLVTDGTDSIVRTNAISASLGGRADLADGGLLVDYFTSSPLASITGLVASGRAGGTWTGPGITSATAAANANTHAIGIAEASETGLTSLFDESFDNTTVIVRYTLLGDATLDGTVNISDFANLAANFNQSGRWFTGDFDYSGTTNIADFALLAQNFNKSLPASRSTVPEPAGVAVALIVIANLRRRAV